MKIILSGYGKMGKEIEKIALQNGHDIHLIIDNKEDWSNLKHLINDADVAIDFSIPVTAVENIYNFFDNGIPVVCGTTGWFNRFEEVRATCQKKNQSLFFATNFSIGVNILFELNKKLAGIMEKFPEYDVKIEETHHIQKLDSPSGTAIVLANEIISSLSRKEKWINTPSSFNNFLEIKSIREGNITGIHNVKYKSDSDSITLRHNTENRSGFARGALMAAEWMLGKKGVFGMNDMLNL